MALMTVDVRDAVLTHPVFGTLPGSALSPLVQDSSLSMPNCSTGRAASGSSRLPIVTAMLPLSTRWYVRGVPQAWQKLRSAMFELTKVDGRPRVQRRSSRLTLANAMNG